jgi:hypothetical protein
MGEIPVLDVCVEVGSTRWSLQELRVDGLGNATVLVDSSVMEFNFQHVSLWIVPDRLEVT